MKVITYKVRKESFKQHSGKVNLNAIPILKNKHYLPIAIPLDGDQPKEYIKAYFYQKGCPSAGQLRKWPGYFAKFGGKSYPHESIIEYIINRIGISLGLNMNEVKLVRINGQIRFLSKDFIQKGQKLVHGIEILAEYFEDRAFVDEINDDRRSRREFLTFDVVEKAIQHVYPKVADQILIELVKLITYDAIVGNNDRHFYNWGIIDFVEKVPGQKVKFSPVYDSARALLWNKTTPDTLRMYTQFMNGADQVHFFVKKTKPRFSSPEDPKADHFQLLAYLSRYKGKYREIIKSFLTDEKEHNAIETLRLTTNSIFCDERCLMMEELLKLRFVNCRKSL